MLTDNLNTQQPVPPKILVYKWLQTPIEYGVMYTIEVDGKKDTIKYETKVSCRLLPGNKYAFRITRLTNTFINDEVSDSIADALAARVAGVLYPLSLFVTADGKVTGIENFADIKSNWEKTKQDIQKNYQGELVEKYVQLADQSLQDENSLLKSLLTDWFLCAFFNTIYQYNGTAFNAEKWVSFPLVAKAAPVLFKATQKIEEDYTAQNLIRLNIAGLIADERCKADFENELNYPQFALQQTIQMASGSYKAQYYLTPFHHAIETCYLECEISLDKKKKISVLVSNLNETKYILPGQEKFTIEFEELAIPKRTFWEKLTGQY